MLKGQCQPHVSAWRRYLHSGVALLWPRANVFSPVRPRLDQPSVVWYSGYPTNGTKLHRKGLYRMFGGKNVQLPKAKGLVECTGLGRTSVCI